MTTEQVNETIKYGDQEVKSQDHTRLNIGLDFGGLAETSV